MMKVTGKSMGGSDFENRCKSLIAGIHNKEVTYRRHTENIEETDVHFEQYITPEQVKCAWLTKAMNNNKGLFITLANDESRYYECTRSGENDTIVVDVYEWVDQVIHD